MAKKESKQKKMKSYQRTLNGCVGWMGEKIFCLSKRVVCRNTLCISKNTREGRRKTFRSAADSTSFSGCFIT